MTKKEVLAEYVKFTHTIQTQKSRVKEDIRYIQKLPNKKYNYCLRIYGQFGYIPLHVDYDKNKPIAYVSRAKTDPNQIWDNFSFIIYKEVQNG